MSERMPQNQLKHLLLLSFLAIMAGGCYWHYFHQTVSLMQVDSGGYVSFHASRTVGYPMFLWAVHKMFDSYTWVPLIQLSLHFMAAIFLSLTFYQLTRTFLLSFGLFSFLLLNVEWIKYDFMILTESLGGTLLLLGMAYMMRFYQHAKAKDLIGLSLAIGLSILIRPVSYALVPVLGGLAYLAWPQVKTRLWALIVPLILVLAVGTLVQRYRNGFWDTESFLGHNLLGKAGIIVDASIPSRHPEAIQELNSMVSPIRETLKHAPDWQMEYMLTAPYYDHMRFTYAGKFGKDTPKASDQYWKEIALDIIKARPLLYIKDVLMNYFSLWFLWDLQTMEESKIFRNLIKDLEPFPYYGKFPMAPRTTEAAQHWAAITLVVRGGLMLSFMASLLIIGYVFFQRFRKKPVDILLQVAFTAALMVNGLYGLTSLLQAGLPRYALFAWPAIGVMILSMITFYWKKYKNDRT